MDLDTVDKLRDAFYRLVGTESGDTGLTEQGESTNEVCDIMLTRGSRIGQRWMLDCGYNGWRKRSAAITWSGTDAADGGRYYALPSDFLRAYGRSRGAERSCLSEANGDYWGQEIDPEQEYLKGDYYYFRGTQIWLARSANPPATLYLEYHYQHPEFDGLADGSIDFPLEARYLIPAEAANVAMEEDWLLGGPEMEGKISRSRAKAREHARSIARQSKQPRRFKKALRYGNRW